MLYTKKHRSSSLSQQQPQTYSPSYPHAAIHPPLRLLTTATCLETLTTLVSAQSPPHSPTYSSFSLPQEKAPSTSQPSSRASSILDGIQSALTAASASASAASATTTTSAASIAASTASLIASNFLTSLTKPSVTNSSSSTYSAAKDSLADFSIPASKRKPIHAATKSSSTTSTAAAKDSSDTSLGVIRSRSNYVSFPNFDDIDFVDVAMVHNYENEERAEQEGEDEEDEEDDADDHPVWSEPGSLPDMASSLSLSHSSNSSAHGYTYAHPNVVHTHRGQGQIGGMPLSPSQHWLLQLEAGHEFKTNGIEA
ncbi:hypothetical protein BGZ94_004714 [Podila epigama]|nr:hypothetical protein BGZ94_004714 [Podila epigama]